MDLYFQRLKEGHHVMGLELCHYFLLLQKYGVFRSDECGFNRSSYSWCQFFFISQHFSCLDSWIVVKPPGINGQ